MITIVAEVRSRNSFERFKANLEHNLPDLYERPDVACIVYDEDLYLECRDYLLNNELVNDRLTVLWGFSSKLSDILTNKNKYTFRLNNESYIPKGTIQTLLEDYLDHPKAGFITGRGSRAVKLRNIYSDVPEHEPISYEGVVSIDSIPTFGYLTRTETFLQYLNDTASDGNPQDYGLYLRRQGYANFLDNRLVYD